MTQPPAQPAQPSPWSYPSAPVAPPPGFDLLGSASVPPDYLAPDGVAVAGGRRRRRTTILIAVAAVVALVLGGAAYAGVRLWYGTGAQPEDAMPSTVVAFARLDLSPGYGQKLKINDLAHKFPQSSGKDVVSELKKGIFSALDVDDKTYQADIAPWFADRIGVGAWLDAKKKMGAVVTLASKDDAAARRGLDALAHARKAGTFGFVVNDGYALVALGNGAQATAEAAQADARRESLAKNEKFHQGVQWLPTQQTAIAWADLQRIGDGVSNVFGSLLGGPMGGPSVGGPTGASPLDRLADLKGHIILGAQATGDGVEIRFRGFGIGGGGPVGGVRSAVDALPGNSAVAGAFRFSDLDQELTKGLLGTDPAQLPPDVGDRPPGLGVPKPSPEELAEARASMEPLAAVGNAIRALSGAQITVAATDFAKNVPALSASATVTSADKAAALTEALKQLGSGVTVTSQGNTVTATTAGYAAGNGTLASQPLYRDALSGAPKNATMVLYVDVQRLLAGGRSAASPQTEPLKAVGVAVGTEAGDPVGLIRVIIR